MDTSETIGDQDPDTIESTDPVDTPAAENDTDAPDLDVVGAAWVEESVTAIEALVKGAALVGMVGLLAYAYVEGRR